MKIVLKRQNNAYHFQGTNEEGNSIDIDGAPKIGGEDKGFRPMQLLAAAAGSCSSIDIISILEKQRQRLDDIKVFIDAEREKDKIPALFSTIHLHYVLTGNLNKDKVQTAINLSLDKYCSVAKILEKTAEITHSFEIKSN